MFSSVGPAVPLTPAMLAETAGIELPNLPPGAVTVIVGVAWAIVKFASAAAGA